MSKCIGCGVRLQYDDKDKKGYTPKKEAKYCLRCFKLLNYHENIQNENVISDEDILNKINKKGIFTFFLTDILNLNNKVIDIYSKITNDKVLVITKVDILPNNLKYSILIDNIKKIYNVGDVILFSKENGFGKNEIMNLCQEYGEVLFSGPTSSGKSSLINYLFKKTLTVSEYKNTTVDFICLNYENIKVYDAPGFNEIYPVKELIFKKKIVPKTVTLNKDYSLFIDDFVIKASDKSFMTLYLHEDIMVKSKKDDNIYQEIIVPEKSEIVISSLGFIYFKNETSIMTNLKDYEIRESVVSYHE